MKFDTFTPKSYIFTAEYWGFTLQQLPDGTFGNPVYSFFRNIPVNMVSDGSGRLFLFTEDGQILKNGQIRKITKTATGTVLVDRTYTISVQEPIIRPLDDKVTYKYWALEVQAE